MGDVKAVMDFALAVHAFAALRLAHQFGKAAFEHAGADSGEDMVAAVFLQHDGVDALEVQELRQQQTPRPAADDANLNLHSARLPGATDILRFDERCAWRDRPLSCTIRTCVRSDPSRP